MNSRTERLLADRQHRAAEQYLQRAKRYLADFTTENRSEQRFQNILSLADKLEPLSPSAEQWERYWNIVAVGQQRIDQLVSTTRVSTAEYSESELSSRELGSGSII